MSLVKCGRCGRWTLPGVSQCDLRFGSDADGCFAAMPDSRDHWQPGCLYSADDAGHREKYAKLFTEDGKCPTTRKSD